MTYDADWIPPWRETEQARCRGRHCTNDGAYPGPLCIASTLKDGLCASCARTPADDESRELRMEV